MTEQETLKSLQKYDNWKQAKKRRKTYLGWIATLIGIISGLLLTWLILKVSPKDTWTLTKGTFASEEKLDEYLPKLDEVDNKLKKSIVAKPLNWISKKHEEQVAKEFLAGNLKAVVSGIRTYCIILILVWFIVWVLIWVIFHFLSYWIIGSLVWKEPKLVEEEI